MCNTCCHQESSANFHVAGQERAAAELAALYESIKNMPDGPQKTHFLKKVCSLSFSTVVMQRTVFNYCLVMGPL